MEEQTQHENEQLQEDQDVSTQEDQQQPIDYEKAYKNLERDYTKKAQRLKELEGWGKFQEQTGISAEQALQQLEAYQGGQTQHPPQHGEPQQYTAPQEHANYAPSEQFGYQTMYDPRVDQLEQELMTMRRERQAAELRKKFPQFDEVYPDVINLADSEGIDLDTAFGKVMVNNWDKFVNQTKQEVVNSIRHKSQKQVESSQSPDDGHSAADSLTEEELAVAQAMGVSPEEYAKAKGSMSID